jgi:hypothetical protein
VILMTIAERTSERGTSETGPVMLPRSAVVWINGRRAILARMSDAGRITTRTIERGIDDETPFLAKVVDAIGDRERVVILGPTSMRLLLEREYVTINARPDHLVDVEEASAVDESALIDRLRELAETR